MAFTRPRAAQIDFDVTNISDPLIRLNSGETGSADKDVGIVIERGDDTNVAIIYDESADQFALVNTTETGSTSGNVTIASYADIKVNAIVYGTLNDGTTALTSTVAELNLLDNVTGLTLGSANDIVIVGSDGTSFNSASLLSIDTGNNRVGINTSSPRSLLDISSSTSGETRLFFTQSDNSTDAPNLRIEKSRGSTGSEAAVQNGDGLYRQNTFAHDGTSYLNVGQLEYEVNGSVSTGTVPTRFAISTRNNSTDTMTQRLQVTGDTGVITFNDAYSFPTSDGSANQVLQTDGSGALSFADVTSYTDGDVASYLSGNTIATSNINVSGDVLPDADNTRSLGSASLQWQEVYIGPGSLYVNGKKVLEESGGTIVVSADADQSLTVKTTGTGVLTLQSATTVNVAGILQIQSGNSITDSAGTAVAFGDPLDMNSNKITELGTPSASTDAATKGYVDTTAASYLPVTGGTISSNLTVSGNFTVNGTTTTINTSTLSIADNLIDLNSDVTSGTPSQDAGIRILRGDSNAVQLRWNETNDKWELTTDGSSYANIAVTGDIPTAVSELTNDSGYITGYTVTQGDVTTHQAALSITESQISDFGTYLTASDITGKLNLSGGTMSGAIAMGANAITGVADPSAAQDAATKAYVDSQVSSVPTGDITSVTASTGLTGGGTTGDVTLSIDSTVATLTGSQTLTNKTLTAPVISSISNTGTLTLPTSTGTVALTSDIPTNVSELTNDSGYSTTTGTVTSVAGTGTINGLTLSGTVTTSGSLTLGGTLSITESQISDLGSYLTAVALNDVSDVTITTPSSGQVLKYNGSAWVNDTDSGGIALADLSITTASAGTAALSYNNTTGVFSYTPPDLSSYLTSYTVSEGDVTTHQAALSITESQISDFGSYITGIDSSAVTTALGFTPYNATNPSGYITGYTVTQSDVTTHQAALSITESQISDLGSYATLASPTLTGTPAAPTATSGTNTTQIATTAFVSTAVANIVDTAPAALDTLNELAAALGDDANFATTTATSLGEKLVKASNLSDLTNAATARTNLGLGTAATTASTDYATAAQGTTANAALPKAGGALTGAVTTNSTFDGRDVATDGTKLDGIEASADVTDATNVTSAGALMDSEVTNLAQVKAFDSSDYATATQGTTADAALARTGGAMTGAITTNSTFDGRDVATDGTKLDGIEASADVTDATNVTAAGALMDSEVTNLAQVKAFDSSDYATAAQGTTADAALPKAGGTMSGAIAMGTSKITGMGDPTTAQDAATKAYVDTQVSAGGGGNAFTTISVATQSDVAADSSTDTLTLAASGLIGITTDASTDTVTIATPSTVALPFLLADGSTSNIDFFTSGKINSVMTNLYIPFTKLDGSAVTTMVVGGA